MIGKDRYLIGVRLTPELHAELMSASKRLSAEVQSLGAGRVSLSAIARQALREYLARYSKRT